MTEKGTAGIRRPVRGRDAVDATVDRLLGSAVRAAGDLLDRAIATRPAKSAWREWAEDRYSDGSLAWSLDACELVSARAERAWKSAKAARGEADPRTLRAELRMLATFVQEATVHVISGHGDVAVADRGAFPPVSASMWLRRASVVTGQLRRK